MSNRSNINFQKGGLETITVGYFGEEGNTFAIAVDSRFAGGYPMCGLETEIDIYPNNGDPITLTVPECNHENQSKRWWFVGCFNADSKLDGFQVYDKTSSLMDDKPDIDMC